MKESKELELSIRQNFSEGFIMTKFVPILLAIIFLFFITGNLVLKDSQN